MHQGSVKRVEKSVLKTGGSQLMLDEKGRSYPVTLILPTRSEKPRKAAQTQDHWREKSLKRGRKQLSHKEKDLEDRHKVFNSIE